MLLIIAGDAHRTTGGRSNQNPYIIENPISPEAVLELGERVHSRFHTARSKKDMEKHNNSTSPRSNRSSVPEHLEGIHSRALLLSSFDTQPFFQFNQSNRILAFFSFVPAPCIVASHCLCLFASSGNFGC